MAGLLFSRGFLQQLVLHAEFSEHLLEPPVPFAGKTIPRIVFWPGSNLDSRSRFTRTNGFQRSLWLIIPRHGHPDQWRSHGSISDIFGASRKFRSKRCGRPVVSV